MAQVEFMGQAEDEDTQLKEESERLNHDTGWLKAKGEACQLQLGHLHFGVMIFSSIPDCIGGKLNSLKQFSVNFHRKKNIIGI